jgi:CheY-like chemotaxis protein
MGLVSVRERFGAMGGGVHVQSLPGNGTTVTLTLPLGGKSMRPVEAQAPSGPASGLDPLVGMRQRVPIRVLLVNDHKLMRQELKDILAADDRIRVVGEAGTGDEALLLAANVAPDVVITEINLTPENGIEMTKRFKSLHPQTVVIGMSAHSEERMKRDIVSAGAETLLSKECSANDLIPTIIKCCDGRVPRR